MAKEKDLKQKQLEEFEGAARVVVDMGQLIIGVC
jgi:hypothetical protein